MTTNNNIVQVHVHLRGIRPFLQHKFGPDALPLTPREKSGVAGNNPEEWRRTCMVDAHGRLYIDSTYIFAAVREGGRYIKSGRRTMLAAVAATLQVLDDPIFFSNRYWPGYTPDGQAVIQNRHDAAGESDNPFDPQTAIAPSQDPNQPVYLDIRGVKNPSTRARNVRYRVACAPGWEVVFTIAFDKSIVSREQMQSALWHAGKLVGIGNGRTIGMGRFDVVSFEPVTTTPEPEATTHEPVATIPEPLVAVSDPFALSNNQAPMSTNQKGAAAGLSYPTVKSQAPLDEKKLIDSTPTYRYTQDKPRQPTSETDNIPTPMNNSVTTLVTPTT